MANFATHTFLNSYLKSFKKLLKDDNLTTQALHVILQRNNIKPNKENMYPRNILNSLLRGEMVGLGNVDIHKLRDSYAEYLTDCKRPAPKPKEKKRWGKIVPPEPYQSEEIVHNNTRKQDNQDNDFNMNDLDWNDEYDMESISKKLERQYHTENKVYEKINKNMKQTIRLTESDLHKVIKESVKQVISELDRRTYYNASTKDYMPQRKTQFLEKSADEFNKQFGYTDDEMGNQIEAYVQSQNLILRIIINAYSDKKEYYYKAVGDDSFRCRVVTPSGTSHMNVDYPRVQSDKRLARNIAKAIAAFDNMTSNYNNGSYDDSYQIDDFHKYLGK